MVIVSANNHIIYQDAVGLASKELNVPITPQSVFRIASIAKQFTALLTILAAREGKFALTDSLARFFPELIDPTWRKSPCTNF